MQHSMYLLLLLCTSEQIPGGLPSVTTLISTIHENAYDGFIDLIQEQVIFAEIDALVCQLN